MTAAQSIPQLQDLDQVLDESASPDLTLGALPLPVTIRPARPLSDLELLAFCSANDGLEIESDADGTVTVMTPAKLKTSRLNQLIAARLFLWAEESGRGVVCGPDLGIRFPDLVLRAPDVAWLSTDRWNEAKELQKQHSGFLSFCPEFIAEIRSDSDRASKVEAKMEFWIERGAQLGWLIDPKRKLAMIYRPGHEPETLLQPDFLEGDGPIQGFRLATREFWE